MALFEIKFPDRIHVDIHVHTVNETQILDLLHFIKQKVKDMPQTQAELAQQLTDLGTQLDKVLGEIQTEVKNLEDAINQAGSTTVEVDNALAALKTKVQALDDLNTDVAPGGGDTGGGDTGGGTGGDTDGGTPAPTV